MKELAAIWGGDGISTDWADAPVIGNITIASATMITWKKL
jgi:hypothetical protein